MAQEPPAGPPGTGVEDAALDITGEVCPMTFVRTKLALERLPRGATLRVRLPGGEPLENVPRSAREHGYAVSEPEEESPGSGIWLLSIRHGGPQPPAPGGRRQRSGGVASGGRR